MMKTTFHVMIGQHRFVDEIHDHIVELRPSTKLLFAFHIKKGYFCVEEYPMMGNKCSLPPVSQVDTTSRKLVETMSAVVPFVHLCSKRPSFLRGRLFPPIFRSEELCQYRSPAWLQDLLSLGHREASVALGFCETWNRTILRKVLDSAHSRRKQ